MLIVIVAKNTLFILSSGLHFCLHLHHVQVVKKLTFNAVALKIRDLQTYK